LELLRLERIGSRGQQGSDLRLCPPPESDQPSPPTRPELLGPPDPERGAAGDGGVLTVLSTLLP
jgi:hypothetical protein